MANKCFSLKSELVQNLSEVFGMPNEKVGAAMGNLMEKIEDVSVADLAYHLAKEYRSENGVAEQRKALFKTTSTATTKARQEAVFYELVNTVESFIEFAPEKYSTVKDVLSDVSLKEIIGEIHVSLSESLQDEFNLEENSIADRIHYAGEFFSMMKSFDYLLENVIHRFGDYVGGKINISNGNINFQLAKDNTDIEEFNNEVSVEESGVTASWQKNDMSQSAYSGMNQSTKTIISRLLDVDHNGEMIMDDLGYGRYLSPNMANKHLLSVLEGITSEKDMMDRLKKEVSKTPWVQQLLDIIEGDPTKTSALFTDMFKDFNTFIVKTTDEASGNGIVKTVNKKTDVEHISYMAKNNMLNGRILSEFSIYDKNGYYIPENISAVHKKITDLIEDVESLALQNTPSLAIAMEKRKDEVEDILNAIGIETIGVDISKILTPLLGNEVDISDSKLYVDKFLRSIRNNIDAIISERVNNSDYQTDISSVRSDYFATMSEALLVQMQGETKEASVSENGRNLYAYQQPSHLTDLQRGLATDNLGVKEAYFKKNIYPYMNYVSENGEFKVDWLRDLHGTSNTSFGVGAKRNKNLFEVVTVAHSDKKKYNELDFGETLLLHLNNYFYDPNNNLARFAITPPADSPRGIYITFNKIPLSSTTMNENGDVITGKQQLLRKLEGVFNNEVERMNLIFDREDLIKKGNEIGIKHFDSKGKSYTLLPFLNRYSKEIAKDFSMENVREILEKGMAEEYVTFRRKLSSEGLLAIDYKATNPSYLYLNINGKDDIATVDAMLEDYFYNDYFAHTQIMQITNGDPAFFKDNADYQKRAKETIASGNKLNIGNINKAANEAKGKAANVQRTMVIKDSVVPSRYMTEIRQILDNNVKKGLIGKEEADDIAKTYESVNETDAQAFTSIREYKVIADAIGKWTPRMERGYELLVRAAATSSPSIKEQLYSDFRDLGLVFEVLKPFTFGKRDFDTKVVGKNGKNLKYAMPTQHKNSIYLLLPFGPQMESPQLKGFHDLMMDESTGVDLIQFDSAIKVGLQGTTDVSNANSVEEVSKILNDASNLPAFYQDLEYENIRIQQNVPEHFIDPQQTIGTQLKRIITSDLPKDATFVIDGVTMNSQEVIDLYNRMNKENIMASMEKLSKSFKTIEDISNLLINEIRSSGRYTSDLIEAVSLVTNESGQKEFKVPLYDPAYASDIESVLTSILKKRVTKKKSKGGSAANASSFGVSKGDNLNIVWIKDESGKATSISHFEVLLPYHLAEDFYSFQDANGDIDIKKIQNDKNASKLLDMIAYRIPTENNYSIFNIKVVGFLPREGGGAIMMPSEVTTMAGLDFDVDKMYLMMNDFSMKNNVSFGDNIGKMHEMFEIDELSDEQEEMLKDVSTGKADYKNMNADDKKLVRAYNEARKENNRINPLAPNYEQLNKDESNSSFATRNNKINSIIQAILSNPEVSLKGMKPGGFEELRKEARIVTIIKNANVLIGIKEAASKEKKALHSYLSGLSLDTLDSILNSGVVEDISNPATRINIKQQNDIAGRLIGIMANSNTFHALAQQLNLNLVPAMVLKISGRNYTAFSRILNVDGGYISTELAQLVAAAMDAIKDPVLNFLNLDDYTSILMISLLMLGVNKHKASMIISHPLIVEIASMKKTSAMKFESDSNKLIDTALENMFPGGMKIDYKKSNGDIYMYSVEKDIMDYSDTRKALDGVIADPNISVEEKIASIKAEFGDTAKDSYAVFGNFLSKLIAISNAVTKLTISSKLDVTSSGPSAAANIYRRLSLEDSYQTIKSKWYNPKNAVFTGKQPIELYNDNGALMNAEEYNKSLTDNPTAMSFIGANYGAVLLLGSELFSKYVGGFQTDMIDTIRQIKDITTDGILTAKEISYVIKDKFSYNMSNMSLFNNYNMELGELKSYMLSKFPSEFIETIDRLKDHYDIVGNAFVENVRLGEDRKLGLPRLEIANVSKKTSEELNDMMHHWEALLQSNDKEIRDLATNLYTYAFTYNGFRFGKNSFMHLLGTDMKRALPGYLESAAQLIESTNDVSPAINNNFILQFLLNNHKAKKFVPKISTECTSIEDFMREFSDGTGQVIIDLGDKTSKNTTAMGNLSKTKFDAGETYSTFVPYFKVQFGSGIYVFENKLPLGTPSTVGTYARVSMMSDIDHKHYEFNKHPEEVSRVNTTKARYEIYGTALEVKMNSNTSPRRTVLNQINEYYVNAENSINNPIFANTYPKAFTIDGKKYSSVEHYVTDNILKEYAKSKDANADLELVALAQELIDNDSSLGNLMSVRSFDFKVPVSKNFLANIAEVMSKGMKASFTQNSELLSLLLETGNKKITFAQSAANGMYSNVQEVALTKTRLELLMEGTEQDDIENSTVNQIEDEHDGVADIEGDNKMTEFFTKEFASIDDIPSKYKPTINSNGSFTGANFKFGEDIDEVTVIAISDVYNAMMKNDESFVGMAMGIIGQADLAKYLSAYKLYVDSSNQKIC